MGRKDVKEESDYQGRGKMNLHGSIESSKVSQSEKTPQFGKRGSEAF